MSSLSDITPASRMFAVTPSDTASIAGPNSEDNIPRGVYVGGAGDLAIKCGDDDAVTLVGVVAGSLLPIRPTRIMAANTTATNIVAVY